MKTTRLALAALAIALAGAAASRASADPTPIYLATVPVYQPAQPVAGAPLGAILAFASTVGASHVERVAFVPVDGLHCDDTDYRTVNVYDVDEFGDVASAGPLASAETTCVGTGSWTAGRVAMSATISYDLPAGHTLAAIWQPIGLGVPTPGGAWRVE